MRNWPLISVISVNYNQSALTCAMIASLKRVTYPNLEIIIVDNASLRDDPLEIKNRYPGITFIRSDKNLGFAGGNNLGIKAATGEYLFFLNNDTEVHPGVFEPLVNFFIDHPEAGIASPKIIYYRSDETIQFAGSKGMNPWTGRSVTIGAAEQDSGQYDSIYESPLIDGAAMMVPSAVIQQAGLMPEIYFLYYEELDWCERIKRAGYRSFYVGHSKIYHKESVSVGKYSVLKTYYMNRNRLLFIRRNSSGWQFWSSAMVFFCLALPKRLFYYVFTKQWDHARALFRGLSWNFRHVAVVDN